MAKQNFEPNPLFSKIQPIQQLHEGDGVSGAKLEIKQRSDSFINMPVNIFPLENLTMHEQIVMLSETFYYEARSRSKRTD